VAREYHLAFVSSVFAAHWVFVTLFAALAMRFSVSLRPVKAVGWSLPPLEGWQHFVIQPMRNWDGFWYSLIATEGYGYHEATTAFFPLFPWSIRFVASVLAINVEIAGYILANLAFLFALIFLYRLVDREWGDGVARRTTILLASFPLAFYFTAVYSESFFLLFTVLAFYWAKTGKWWLAGLATMLAGLTRNLGVLLAIPLAIIFLKQYWGVLRRHWKEPLRWPRDLLAFSLVPLGPVLYFLYLGLAFGNPLLTLDAQKGWARERAMPWTTVQMALHQWDLAWLRDLIASPTWSTLTSAQVRMGFAEYESLDIFMACIGLAMLVYCFLKLPIEYSLYCAVLFVLPMFSPSTVHPLMSVGRFTAVLFPLFIALGLLTRRRSLLPLLVIPSAALMALLIIQFSTWFWVA
jgi:hypothetical protein